MPLPLPPFRLLRWFGLLSAAVIGAIAIANGALMSQFLNQQLFQREATITADFVRNILLSDGSLEHLRDQSDPELKQRFKGSLVHLGNLRDVLRANVYLGDRRLLWSTNKALVGQVFTDNDELDEALRGELVVHAGHIPKKELDKREHEGLGSQAQFFVEIYIPILDAKQQVIGVVELYKAPLALTHAIQTGRQMVATAALLSALLLFGSLYWLVRRADRTLRAQQAQLLDAETLAAVGELAASVAHNIRNPLASIRSSAELALDASAEQARENAQDILRDADRISSRINELLRLAKPVGEQRERVGLADLLRRCAAEQTQVFERRQQSLALVASDTNAATQADPQLLRHLLDSLLANAAEAMGPGGRCALRLKPTATPGFHQIEIEDAGSGMPPEVLKQVARPFFTTKPQGLGLGLALARRTVERLGGRLAVYSAAGAGTTITIELPSA